ncbi:MAG: DNA-binding protein WhiA [Gaiellaceae bacterium]
MTSEDIREELARIAPVRACDRLAELSALFHSAGNLHLRGKGKWALHLDLASGAAARRAFSLLRDVEIRSEIRTYRRRAFDRATRFQLHVEGSPHALRTFVAAGVLDRRARPIERPPRRVVVRACCRSAYLRGAFLGGGSLSVHRSPHLELRTAAVASATLLRDLAATSHTRLSVVERPTYAAAYATSWDAIESVLALAGASEAVLALEERAVVAATSGHANRRANADHANLVRTSKAAQLQLEAVRRLKAMGRIERLEAPLREVADLRLLHPTESLRELATRTDPPVSRASVHRRLRQLFDLASGDGANMPR